MGFAAEVDGKVVLDRLDEISRGGAPRQTAGEFIEVVDLVLAPLQSIDLVLQSGRKMTCDKRDKQE